MKTDLPVEMNLMRIVAQGLVPATASATPVDVVRRMLATQGQITSNVPHSLISRTTDSVGSDVEEAFESGALVRSWPFRGTLHITTAEDYRWLRALWGGHSWFNRASNDVGLDEQQVDRARGVALEALADSPQTRAGLREHWLSRGVGSHLSEEERARLIYILFVQFHQDGTFVSGPIRGNEHLIVDACSLVGDSSGWASRIDDGDPQARREAFAEIARRYAITHGPITVEDFVRWAGCTKATARQALADAVEAPGGATDVDVRLTVAHLDGKKPVPGAPADAKAPTFYLRSDLWDLTDANRADASKTLYLAMFDELHVGYGDRTCLTDKAGEKLICPGGNGMFRPLVVDKGRMVAVNPKNLGLQWYKTPSKRLERDTERAMKKIGVRLSR